VFIPCRGIDGKMLYEPNEIAEIEHFARERVESGWKKAEAERKPVLTRVQQHDLGAVLMDIKASNRRRRQTLHGRYW